MKRPNTYKPQRSEGFCSGIGLQLQFLTGLQGWIHGRQQYQMFCFSFHDVTAFDPRFDLRLAICTAFAGMVIALDETGPGKSC